MGMKVFTVLASFIYLIAAVSLVVLSLSIMAWSVYGAMIAIKSISSPVDKLLESVGAIIISIAVLDVAKYLVEEEVLKSKELRSPSEARRMITKIFVIISIAAGMEGLVYIFKTGNQDVTLLIYPAILILLSSLTIVCLGIFQKMSVAVEEIDIKEKG
ncbi:MAG: hypothetical protein JXR29_02835 [Methylothermaceae bacterium]|nr:hypothetical protein [Methylothermaceae bacterium]